MTLKILVVGGAGYIGSHMVKLLVEKGHRVVTLDNLSHGYRDAICGGELVVGDLAEPELLRNVLSSCRFDAVLHFASLIQVGESINDPRKYYRGNVTNTLNLLDAMIETETWTLVFSSSAAVFGDPKYVPIDEAHPRHPVNPYGVTKLIIENLLGEYEQAYGLRSIALRYFNAAGADPGGRLGERHVPETHLIPLALETAARLRPTLTVNGRDYPTPDGTCIRDYIHVVDLCEAHLLAVQLLCEGASSASFNLGNGEGYSVDEVIHATRRVTGREVPVVYGARRRGDPARLVADYTLARRVLGWRPKYTDIDTMIAHAWQYQGARKIVEGEHLR